MKSFIRIISRVKLRVRKKVKKWQISTIGYIINVSLVRTLLLALVLAQVGDDERLAQVFLDPRLANLHAEKVN